MLLFGKCYAAAVLNVFCITYALLQGTLLQCFSELILSIVIVLQLYTVYKSVFKAWRYMVKDSCSNRHEIASYSGIWNRITPQKKKWECDIGKVTLIRRGQWWRIWNKGWGRGWGSLRKHLLTSQLRLSGITAGTDCRLQNHLHCLWCMTFTQLSQCHCKVTARSLQGHSDHNLLLVFLSGTTFLHH